jgi:hypothetical protein
MEYASNKFKDPDQWYDEQLDIAKYWSIRRGNGEGTIAPDLYLELLPWHLETFGHNPQVADNVK